ncbi:uncharacterized protein LOC143509643 [Brachyhypopomus gauderio]|uniref:uncharacterized protein LOC143509643 n=1 Tax=Brachyhypopomus gauderio TaxID=698409 RepID=UPI004041BFB8
MGRGRGRSSLSAEGSELQLVAPSHPGKQLTTPENDRHLSLPLTDPAVRTNVSQNAELECSSALTEMEMDEVFAISTRTCTAREAFLSHAQHERFLQHSDTEASQLWTAPTSPGVSTVTEGVHVGSVSSARPRAWRVRTFEDFLSPLPPLQKRWGNWMTSRPFTKLGTSGSAFSPAKPHNDTRGRDLSDTMLLDQLNDTRGEDLFDGMLLDQLNGCNSKSSGSSTPYSPVQQAQRQQRVNLVGGLWRLCFTGSDFGPLSSASESSTPPGGANRNATTACHQHPEPNSTTSGQQEMQEQVESGNCSAEDDHLQVPMFAILEEDDRQPLVLAEHGARPSMGNNKGYESPKKSRALAETPVRLTKEPLGHFEKHVM